MGHCGFNYTFNVDGFISYSGRRTETSSAYVQIFRNGIIEATTSLISNSVIGIDQIEDEIIYALREYSNKLKVLNVEPPAYIFLNLVGVKGLTLPRTDRFDHIDSIPIQKDIITLPNFELQIFGMMTSEEESELLTKSLKISFDALSNSVGLPRSYSYNEIGVWIRRSNN